MAFKDGKPTCNHFVINTYLYLAFSICFLGIVVYYIHIHLFEGKSGYSEMFQKIMPYFWILFIVSIISVISIAMQPTFGTSTSGVIYNHIMWLFFVIIVGITMTPRIMSKETQPYINETLYSVISIFILMSIIVYAFPVFFERTYGFMYSALLISLITAIIMEIINYFISENDAAFTQNRRYISYFVILIFSAYISYDTKRVIKLSNVCIKYPNYPKTSIHFFLDLINLFSRILFLKSNR